MNHEPSRRASTIIPRLGAKIADRTYEGDRQSDARATETPFCGWVVPNHLDESLMIYDGGGQALGVIPAAGGWQRTPGAPAVQSEQIGDTHLRAMVAYLLARDIIFLASFYTALDSALERIDPENFAQHQDLALLMGRPIALVRATVSLEVQGLPAVHLGWNQLRQDLRRETRDTDGFTAVQIPIRVGDYAQFNDGLVGYWKETGDGFEDVFYAPQSQAINHPQIRTHADGELAILQSLDAPPQTLSMLLDPRGKLHATCGVLPVKVIDIPPEQHADALRRIEVTFVAGPILSGSRQLGLPLPAEPGLAWSWIERAAAPAAWRETWIFPTIERQAFERGLAQLLWERLLDRAAGWIRPVKDAPDQAEVVAPADRAAKTLPEAAATVQTQIERLLEQERTPDMRIARAGFLDAAAAAIGRPLWDYLLGASVEWLAALPGDQARIVIKSSGSTPELKDDYAGMDRVVQLALDLYQVGIVPPGSAAGLGGSQVIREGWLKLRAAEPAA